MSSNKSSGAGALFRSALRFLRPGLPASSRFSVSQGLRLTATLFAAMALAACSAPAMLRAGERLTPQEGGIVIMSHSEFNDVTYEFRKKGSFEAYLTPPGNAGIAFSVIKVPPGEYYLTEIRVGRYTLNDLDFIDFHVGGAQLNYFGDVFVSRAFDRGEQVEGHASVQCIDKQDQLESYLRKKFPTVLELNKLEYTRNVDTDKETESTTRKK